MEKKYVKKIIKKILTFVRVRHLPPYNYFKNRINHKIFPNYICFEVTKKCNLDCVMCSYFFKRPFKNRRELTCDEIKHIIDQISKYNPKTYVSITGGEPFMRSDIVDILSYLTYRQVTYGVLSNGTMEKKLLEDSIHKISPERIQISLDGPKNIHEKIRRIIGSYEKTVHNLKFIKQNTNWKILIVCIINTLNVKYLTDVADIAEELGIDLCFEHVGFLTHKRLVQQKEILRKEFGIREQDIIWDKNKEWLGDFDIETLYKQMQHIYRRKRRINVFYSPFLDRKDISRYYGFPDEEVLSDNCYFPWFGARINCYGDLFMCRGPYFPVGNVVDSDIMNLYNNDRAQDYRSYINKSLLPACMRCPWCVSGDLMKTVF